MSLGKILGASDLIQEIGETIRQVLPDKNAARELEYKLSLLEQEVQLSQIETNKVEASHSNIFVAGWRPAMGWVSVSVIAYTYILAPFMKFGLDIFGHSVPLPVLDLEALWPIILGMLGIGGMRSFEKSKGLATSMGGVIHKPTGEIIEVPKPPKKKGWFN